MDGNRLLKKFKFKTSREKKYRKTQTRWEDDFREEGKGLIVDDEYYYHYYYN